MDVLQLEKGACQNAVVASRRPKEQSNFIASITSRIHRKANKRQGRKSLCSHSSLNEIENDGAMRGEDSECERLKQKNILVAKWIIDCEEEMKRERKQKLIDSRSPWWMKTALERRSSRIKRIYKDENK